MLMYTLITVYVVGVLAHYRFVYIRILREANWYFCQDVDWLDACRSYRRDHGIRAWTTVFIPLIRPAVVVFIFVYDGIKGVIESYE